MKIMPGNGISRQYHNARRLRNRGWAMFGLGTTLAGVNAVQKEGLLTIILGASALLWGKITEGAVNNMLSLKDQYKPILDRAKQIKAAKH